MSRFNAKSARKMVLAAPIDSAELSLRILEAFYSQKRPANVPARDCLNRLDPDARASALRAAKAAADYFVECVNRKEGTVQ